jgi:hypothetical protein
VPVDRRAVVGRHDVIHTAPDAQSPLTVGNGDFACTVDITGMQTFTEFHDPARAGRERLVTNTCTQTSWAWHENPSPREYALDEAMSAFSTARGVVEYPDRFDMRAMFGGEVAPEMEAGAWLYANPHRLDLGRVGLLLRRGPEDRPESDPAVLDEVHQRLDLWSGTVHSTFRYAGERVSVTTAADPEASRIAFRIESSLLATGQAEVGFAFPYASAGFMQTADWDAAERHSTEVTPREGGAVVSRTLDATSYTVALSWTDGELRAGEDPHHLVLRGAAEVLDLVVSYSPAVDDPPAADAGAVIAAAAAGWERFWQSGAAADFGRCSDPRAGELERRVVLSQYLTAVNCSGRMPPQETGLVANSWGGKFHLEMHWWNAAHFVPWGRPELLRRSLDWYRSVLPAARRTAARQGYEGVRWPKQVGPEGRESPGDIGPFLVWQQPHVLYFAELLYRNEPAASLVDELAELVAGTAAFMASFVEERDGAFHLTAPLIPAQEFYDRRTTEDPTFELAYWWWGLEVAQRWRERQGLDRDLRWSDVQSRLAQPHQRDGQYTAIATEPYLKRDDHPSLLAALGVVPATPLIDAAVMRATLADVIDNWQWETAWGWDFPVLAMCAARLGDPTAAVNALLMDLPKNDYLVNGHNAQMGNFLPIYLPGNGGLLAAVSLMLGGWDEAPRPAPGVPGDGTWDVEHEGFARWP